MVDTSSDSNTLAYVQASIGTSEQRLRPLNGHACTSLATVIWHTPLSSSVSERCCATCFPCHLSRLYLASSKVTCQFVTLPCPWCFKYATALHPQTISLGNGSDFGLPYHLNNNLWRGGLWAMMHHGHCKVTAWVTLLLVQHNLLEWLLAGWAWQTGCDRALNIGRVAPNPAANSTAPAPTNMHKVRGMPGICQGAPGKPLPTSRGGQATPQIFLGLSYVPDSALRLI